jgi:uncharacterized protein YgiM (DUF1202 family)
MRRAAVAVATAVVLPLALLAFAPQAQAADTTYKGKVTTTTLNVRKAPTSASAKVGSLSKGTTIKIECKVLGPRVDGNALWYKLATGRWVTARYVSNVGAAPRFCGTGKEYKGKVVASSLNVRHGPHTSEPKISPSAKKGEILSIVCKVDSQKVDGNPRWYQLASDSVGHWVAARYVSNVGTAPPYC